MTRTYNFSQNESASPPGQSTSTDNMISEKNNLRERATANVKEVENLLNKVEPWNSANWATRSKYPFD